MKIGALLPASSPLHTILTPLYITVSTTDINHHKISPLCGDSPLLMAPYSPDIGFEHIGTQLTTTK
jgi:hypothetical protein